MRRARSSFFEDATPPQREYDDAMDTDASTPTPSAAPVTAIAPSIAIATDPTTSAAVAARRAAPQRSKDGLRRSRSDGYASVHVIT